MPKLNPTQSMLPLTGLTDEDTIRWIKKTLNPWLATIIRKIALADDICQVQNIELIKSGNRAGDDGNLKITWDGDNIVEQFKVSGTWTTKRKSVPPS